MNRNGRQRTEVPVPVGDLLTLAEAGYLRDMLCQEGIRAVVPVGCDKMDAREAIYPVLVPAQELEAALEARRRLLPEDRHEHERDLFAPR